MAIRQDGKDTKQKILEISSKFFAEKGYLDARVSEICKEAGANLAAVNYHFGSKERLYTEVWRKAFAEALEIYPIDGGLGEDASAEELLRALVNSLLHRVLDKGKLGYAGKILMTEMGNPSKPIQIVMHDAITPLQKRTQKLISRILGAGATEREVLFCQMSLIHQVLTFGMKRDRHHPAFQKILNMEDTIEALADHITLFSLAGMAAVREKIELRNESRMEAAG